MRRPDPARRWAALVLVLVLVLLSWWWWPRPAAPPTPELEAAPPAARRLPPSMRRTVPERVGAWDTARPMPEPTVGPDAGTLVVRVVDERGRPWAEQVFVESVDCDLRRPTKSGSVRFVTTEPRCTVEARMRDGVLARKSDIGVATVSPGAVVELTLTMPSTRAAGVGVGLARTARGIAVATVIPGSPADLAGLQSGDIVVAVDGDPLTDREMDDVVDALIGPEGSTVEITVGYTADTGDTEERLRLTRAVIEL